MIDDNRKCIRRGEELEDMLLTGDLSLIKQTLKLKWKVRVYFADKYNLPGY